MADQKLFVPHTGNIINWGTVLNWLVRSEIHNPVEHLKTWAKNNALELNDLKTAQLLDQQDPLKSYRDQFFIPQIEDLQEDGPKNEKKGNFIF